VGCAIRACGGDGGVVDVVGPIQAYRGGLWRGGEKWAKDVRLICRLMHIYTGINVHTIEEISSKPYMPLKEIWCYSPKKK
jgi:hypothetical protein